ncbi:MAG: FAD binding domain-containing protein [Nocardioides sp.]
MKPSAFTYHRPTTLEEALHLLAELGDDAKVLAGGQSLVPLMSMRLSAPGHLVDINQLPGLGGVDVLDDGAVEVGALARHAQVERDQAAYAACPLLRQALGQVAHPTIRNRGTTVGSLVHADPSAEMPAVLLVLGGVLEVRSATGARLVAAADLVEGPMQSSLRTGELAVAARFPGLSHRTGSAFVELARRQGDYALAGVAAVVSCDADGAVTRARVALISVGPGPVGVDLSAAVSGGGGGFEESRVRELLDAAIEPEGDIHASADYRRHLAHVLTLRALGEAHEHAATRARRAA